MEKLIRKRKLREQGVIHSGFALESAVYSAEQQLSIACERQRAKLMLADIDETIPKGAAPAHAVKMSLTAPAHALFFQYLLL